eukprot:EG_transcript_5645
MDALSTVAGALSAAAHPVLAAKDVAVLLGAQADAVDAFAAGQPEGYQRLLHATVQTLNAPDVAVKLKTDCLVFLLTCAKGATGARGPLLQAVKGLDQRWEQTLADKEQGRERYGTGLGRLHEYTLLLLSRLCDHQLRAAQLLEFCNHKLPFALFLLAAALKVQGNERAFRVNCLTMLVGFTQPSTYFAATAGEGAAHEEFQRHVNAVLAEAMRASLLSVAAEAAAEVVKQSAGALDREAHAAVQALMGFAMNGYAFASEAATTFRQSLLLTSGIVEKVALPYVSRSVALIAAHHRLPTAYDDQLGPLPPPLGSEAVGGLTACLGFLALAAFRMGRYSDAVRPHNTFTADILGLPAAFLVGQPTLLARLLHCNVNIDALAGELHLPDELRRSLPPACESASLVKQFTQLLASCPLETLVGLQGRFLQSGSLPVAHDCTTFSVLANLLVQSIEARRLQAEASAAEALATPAVTDDELDRLTADLDRHLADLALEKEEVEHIKESLRGCVSEEEPPAKPTPQGPPRLLGPLPPLGRGSLGAAAIAVDAEDLFASQMIKPQMPRSITAPTRPPPGMPPEFLCAINGHVMKNPVTSPTGHTFEKETIEYWLKQNGSLCPLTGQPLARDQLVLDKKLQRRIASWWIAESMKTQDETEKDLYSF